MAREAACLKCGGRMDTGVMGVDTVCYRSDRTPKKGLLAAMAGPPGVYVQHARACLACGYLELYLDPEALAEQIGG